MTDTSGDFRERLAKLVGMLGSASAGERENAHAALSRALQVAGKTWAYLCDLVASAEPRDSELVRRRARLVASLLIPRVNEALAVSFSLSAVEGKTLSELKTRIESGTVLADLNSAEGLERIEHAIEIIGSVKKRNGRAA